MTLANPPEVQLRKLLQVCTLEMLRFARPLPAVARVTSAFSKNDSQNLHLLRSFASGAKALKSAKNGAKAAGNAKIVAAKQAKAQQQQDVDPYMEAAATAKSDVPNTQTQKIVCSMTELSKKLPNGNFLFRNISLSFFQGAKIGVIGINGAGKVRILFSLFSFFSFLVFMLTLFAITVRQSSLMKIIAGIDTDFEGEMKIADGFKVGYLAQEPKLDGEKTVRQVVDDSLSERRQLLHDYEEISGSEFNSSISFSTPTPPVPPNPQIDKLIYMIYPGSQDVRAGRRRGDADARASRHADGDRAPRPVEP